MPTWEIHRKWGKKIGISGRVSNEVSRIIDMGPIHDLGRVIAYGQWDPYLFFKYCALFYWGGKIGNYVIGRYGTNGIKAFILHHVMDYHANLVSKNVDTFIYMQRLLDSLQEIVESAEKGSFEYTVHAWWKHPIKISFRRDVERAMSELLKLPKHEIASFLESKIFREFLSALKQAVKEVKDLYTKHYSEIFWRYPP